MPPDNTKQVIYVKNLDTKSATFYPSRARIVREINNVLLKPGVNELEIFGLSPTVDEHSIQIDGRGLATVLDMTVELVPNRDIFEEVYPDNDDNLSDEESGEDTDEDVPAVQELKAELSKLQTDLAEHIDTQESAKQRIAAVDLYVRSVNSRRSPPSHLHRILEAHKEEREGIFKTIAEANKAIEVVSTQIKSKQREMNIAGKEARKLKAKEKKQRQLKRAEQNRATQYEKDERLRYWPKKVFRVVLQLETGAQITPLSSKRNSFDSVTLAQSAILHSDDESKQEVETAQHGDTLISLSLSYITREAAWTPHYDIKVSSVSKTAVIVYRTEFINNTSETWKDAKISFSTLQTSYQGLDDGVPQINPWRVKLSKDDSPVDSDLLSVEEISSPRGNKQASQWFNRQQYFGKEDRYVPPDVQGIFKSKGHGLGQGIPPPPPGMSGQLPMQYSHPAQQFQHAQQQQMQAGIPPYHPVTDTGNHALQDYQMQLMLLEQQNKKRLLMARQEQAQATAPQGPDNMTSLAEFDFDSFEVLASTWEDNGLTTTYDIPHTRTIAPSSQNRRHTIASLTASNVSLSYIAVPKLRSAAFLLAKIRNPSEHITLLKGNAGVTLDGSFLGRMALPRVSPNQTFQLSFGVDPAIQIAYPKPSVNRSTHGLFTKEGAHLYSRSIWLTNTKNAPVDLVVVEQVPVSEDDRLRIEIVTPRGLTKEGDAVTAGISAKEAVRGNISAIAGAKQMQQGSWGSAIARLKKNGEVAFAVKLLAGGGCLLQLEYEAKLPTNERIVAVRS